MSELTNTIEPKSEFIVAEGTRRREPLLSWNSNFELVLSPSIRDDLPVMDTVHEGLICDQSPKQVILLIKESMPIIQIEVNFFWT